MNVKFNNSMPYGGFDKFAYNCLDIVFLIRADHYNVINDIDNNMG